MRALGASFAQFDTREDGWLHQLARLDELGVREDEVVPCDAEVRFAVRLFE